MEWREVGPYRGGCSAAVTGIAADEPDPNGAPDTRVLTAEPGLNRHNWDLTYPGMERFEGLILWGDMDTGPTAVPRISRPSLPL